MTIFCRFRPGLRFKLLAAIVSVVAIAVACVGYFTIRYSYQALKSQRQQDELSIARNIVAQVEEALSHASQSVEALAQDPAIVSMDRSRQREALTLATRVTELLDGILVMDQAGRSLVTDQTEPRTEDLLPKDDRRHLLEPSADGARARFSEVFASRSGESVLAINAPIRRAGAQVGVLSGVILLKNHSLGGIEGIRIGKSGYAYLVDSRGNVIVRPRQAKLHGDLSSNPAVRELLRKREGVMEFVNQDGVAIMAAIAPIEQTGWGVVVRQPASEAYALGRRMLLLIMLACILG
ncbi:MAG: cache domain-containing protein, partial [Elusimicrobia bacterium]|nr:cache domain-containing protein [Elusimicrobiota bacterium]